MYKLSPDTCEDAVFAFLVSSLVTIFESEDEKKTEAPWSHICEGKKYQRANVAWISWLVSSSRLTSLKKGACTFNSCSHTCWVTVNYIKSWCTLYFRVKSPGHSDRTISNEIDDFIIHSSEQNVNLMTLLEINRSIGGQKVQKQPFW